MDFSLPLSHTHDGVFISTYGCQMNVNDSERMLSLLEMLNYRSVPSPEDASLIIINSCSIREKPVHKVHSEVGRYRILKQKNPRLKIGVSGCVAQQERDRLLKDLPLIDFVFGPDNIDNLPEIVGRLNQGEKINQTRFQYDQPYHVETLVRNPGVSTFVNITKGCDNFCTFCIVPFTRGRERSRPLNQVLEDIKRLIDRGVKEVTLLGQNVNSYKSDCGANFGQLLERLASETAIQRIRFTTPHPKDFDEDLIDIMNKHRQKIMEHIHLPLQSGNTEILEKMNRGYSREDFLKKARMINERLPGVVLTTDIIVGFPGETDEQFMDTMTLLDEVAFENIFAFAYSARPFTKAAKLKDQLSEEEKNERLVRLLGKHREIAFKMAERYRGQTLEVLVEEEQKDQKGVLRGRSRTNKVVHFSNGDKSLIGQMVAVQIHEAFPMVLKGERILN